jgi:nicotinic acetylcholine receptor alpha-2
MIFILSLLYLTNSVVSDTRHVLQTNIYNNHYNIIPNNGINLSLTLAIRAFNNIDQIDGSINMNVWLRYEWNDPSIIWNKEYNNISLINLNTNPDYESFIWTPDIYLYNTAEKPMNELDYTKANVYNNGRIFWSRPGLIKSTCIFDLTYYPYDQQECKLKFGSWSYNKNEIYLTQTNNSIDISNYQEHEEWTLVDYSYNINSIKYDCCEEEFQDIEFLYTIRRKPDYYRLNIIIPTFATATLIILTLLVPWDSGERISFAVTVLLSIIVFLLIVSENLPKTDSKPLLSRMIVGLIYFSLVGVLFTIIISCIHNSIQNKTIKQNKIMIHLFSRCKYIQCCINKKLIRSNSYNNAISSNENGGIQQNDISSNDSLSVSSIDSVKTNPSIYTHENELNLDECKLLTIKIEKIFIGLFFVSFVIYCLVIFLNIPNYEGN